MTSKREMGLLVICIAVLFSYVEVIQLRHCDARVSVLTARYPLYNIVTTALPCAPAVTYVSLSVGLKRHIESLSKIH